MDHFFYKSRSARSTTILRESTLLNLQQFDLTQLASLRWVKSDSTSSKYPVDRTAGRVLTDMGISSYQLQLILTCIFLMLSITIHKPELHSDASCAPANETPAARYSHKNEQKSQIKPKTEEILDFSAKIQTLRYKTFST